VLEGGNLDLGPDWENLVKVWWRLECCSKFATSVSVLGRSVRKRRTDIKKKTDQVSSNDESPKGGRGMGEECAKGVLPDIGNMEEEWWGWWKAINPKWRLHDGELLAGEENGDVGFVEVPGPERVPQRYCVFEVVALLHGDTI
jgi:hypothetical protein